MSKKAIAFDHEGPVTEARFMKTKYLLQEGKPFTYAEYNRYTGKWEPEPEPITDKRALYRNEVETRLGRIENTMEALMRELKEIKPLLAQFFQGRG